MEHEDEPGGEDLCQVFFIGSSGGVEEPKEDGLSDLASGLQKLHIKEPVAQHHTDIKVSSASVRRLGGPHNP